MTMLRSIFVALGAAACLFAFAALEDLPGGSVARALAGVTLGVVVTALVYGRATFATVALGAISPLVFAALRDATLGGAAAAMCLLWLAPRFVLTGTPRRLGALVAISCGAAAVAGFISAAHWDAPFATHAAACVFAGSCLSLVGIIVPVATTTAYALRTAAAVIAGPAREVLLRAAEAHESSRWHLLESATRRKWRTIVRHADQRAALERATFAKALERRRDIEERIEDVARELLPVPGDATVPPPPAAPSEAERASATEV